MLAGSQTTRKSYLYRTDGADNNETLEDLVISWTGCPSLPPDITTILLVKYLKHHQTKVLAESSTCMLELSIPVVHRRSTVYIRMTSIRTLLMAKLVLARYRHERMILPYLTFS